MRTRSPRSGSPTGRWRCSAGTPQSPGCARRRACRTPSALAKVEAPENASWRPFQLAFVLLNLPSLTDPAHPERAAASAATVDLLFFPTGGGKTEAYLGPGRLHLRDPPAAGHGRHGDGRPRRRRRRRRAHALHAAAAHRPAVPARGRAGLRGRGRSADERRGDAGERRRSGSGCGSAAGRRPNWFDEADEQIADARGGRQRPAGQRAADAVAARGAARRSPATGTSTADDVRAARVPLLRERRGRGSLPVLRGPAPARACRSSPSTRRSTGSRRRWSSPPSTSSPSCPGAGRRRRCSARSASGARGTATGTPTSTRRTGCASRHNAKAGWPAVTSRPVVRLRPPDLIIQDELHLISGALGTTVGLFESAVDELCTWRPAGRHAQVGPKIVASTATTKRAARAGARRLRPASWRSSRRRCSTSPTRSSPPGAGHRGQPGPALPRASAPTGCGSSRPRSGSPRSCCSAGQTAVRQARRAADPYMTLVGYFNATRELAGMRRYLDDDVATRVRRHGRRKGLSDRLVARPDADDRGADLADLLRRHQRRRSSSWRSASTPRSTPRPPAGHRRRLAALAQGPRRSAGTPHALAERSGSAAAEATPVDVVLATSMLQVGVDVSRLGLMVVTGQPKNTAEYIQASSRVGRDARPARAGGHALQLGAAPRPRPLRGLRALPRHLLPAGRGAVGHAVHPPGAGPEHRRRCWSPPSATSTSAFSRNRDAQDVPLDGPVVARVFERHAGPRRGDRRRPRPELPAGADQAVRRRVGAVADRAGSGSSATRRRQQAGDPARPAAPRGRRCVGRPDRGDVHARDRERDQPAASPRTSADARLRRARRGTFAHRRDDAGAARRTTNPTATSSGDSTLAGRATR